MSKGSVAPMVPARPKAQTRTDEPNDRYTPEPASEPKNQREELGIAEGNPYGPIHMDSMCA